MLLITKLPAISTAAANTRKDHPPPVLGRLLATGAGRFFFMELPASPIVLVRVVGMKLLTKVPPRSMVSLAEPMPPPPPELPPDPPESDSSLRGSFLSGGGVVSSGGGVVSSGGGVVSSGGGGGGFSPGSRTGSGLFPHPNGVTSQSGSRGGGGGGGGGSTTGPITPGPPSTTLGSAIAGTA